MSTPPVQCAKCHSSRLIHLLQKCLSERTMDAVHSGRASLPSQCNPFVATRDFLVITVENSSQDCPSEIVATCRLTIKRARLENTRLLGAKPGHIPPGILTCANQTKGKNEAETTSLKLTGKDVGSPPSSRSNTIQTQNKGCQKEH